MEADEKHVARRSLQKEKCQYNGNVRGTRQVPLQVHNFHGLKLAPNALLIIAPGTNEHRLVQPPPPPQLFFDCIPGRTTGNIVQLSGWTFSRIAVSPVFNWAVRIYGNMSHITDLWSIWNTHGKRGSIVLCSPNKHSASGNSLTKWWGWAAAAFSHAPPDPRGPAEAGKVAGKADKEGKDGVEAEEGRTRQQQEWERVSQGWAVGSRKGQVWQQWDPPNFSLFPRSNPTAQVHPQTALAN